VLYDVWVQVPSTAPESILQKQDVFLCLPNRKEYARKRFACGHIFIKISGN